MRNSFPSSRPFAIVWDNASHSKHCRVYTRDTFQELGEYLHREGDNDNFGWDSWEEAMENTIVGESVGPIRAATDMWSIPEEEE